MELFGFIVYIVKEVVCRVGFLIVEGKYGGLAVIIYHCV